MTEMWRRCGPLATGGPQPNDGCMRFMARSMRFVREKNVVVVVAAVVVVVVVASVVVVVP